VLEGKARCRPTEFPEDAEKNDDQSEERSEPVGVESGAPDGPGREAEDRGQGARCRCFDASEGPAIGGRSGLPGSESRKDLVDA